ncbi:MAG: Rrf2 family transcriptional regulator [Candidatus Sumerlaeia bacterium]|nr:Rrf2 family transcriptional regulator [Candidatus Sumerlaeia bacterium]
MLTQTSESAIRALIYITLSQTGRPVTPKEIAGFLGESPSYMAKITRELVRANILRSHRGAAGGVSLNRAPSAITLRNVVEACQGLLVGNYCEELRDHPEPVCNFHKAMKEVHYATISVLQKWTLADLVARPGPDEHIADEIRCRMGFIKDADGRLCNCRTRLEMPGMETPAPTLAAPPAPANRSTVVNGGRPPVRRAKND